MNETMIQLRPGEEIHRKYTGPSIEMLKTEALIPYARNSRTHSEEQVAQIAGSIKEFGFTNPVLVGADNDIIAGHGRVMAARKMGLDEVPCIRLGHLTEAQKKAYVIADNKLALNAGWDDEMLKVEMRELEEMGFDLALTGFDEEEIGELLAEATEVGNTDPDDVPEEPETPVSAPRLFGQRATLQSGVEITIGITSRVGMPSETAGSGIIAETESRRPSGKYLSPQNPKRVTEHKNPWNA
jgi:hypothetical protein